MGHIQDAYGAQEELLAELREWIVSDQIQVTTDDTYVQELQVRYPRHFPHEGAEIVEVSSEEGYEGNARAFFEEIAALTGLKESDRLVVLGDAGLDVAIHLPARLLREHFAAITDIPQHIYIVPEDMAWCLSFRMERDMVFGRARPREEVDAEAETRSPFEISVRVFPAPPPRLYVIMAREAPMAVIFRRGPSRWVQLIRWDTASDTFTPGQWFHGRIYEGRCDLSPDGTLLLYFARKINRRTLGDDAYTYAWTAISRPPYLTALALWPKGDCWHGGGLFETNHRVWLNHRPDAATPHPDHRPHRRMEIVPNPDAFGEDTPVEGRRRTREGWKMRQEIVFHETSRRKTVTDRPQVIEREHPGGHRTLLETATAFGWEEIRYDYAVEDSRNNTTVPIAGARWANWDQSGRLVFARDGRIYAADIDDAGRIHEWELADFNANRPEALASPEWARKW